MEWCLQADHEAAAELRREVRAYLERHAAPDADIDGAELVVSELVTNSVEHARTAIWVSLDWGAANPVLTVQDLGEEFALTAPAVADDFASGRGLMIADALSLDIASRPKAAGGTRVQATLDVERAPSPSIDHPVSRRYGRLPAIEEANDEGYFGRESFLKALVVEVANAVELEHGPAVAEDVVARVGASVGDQMETAFRRHRALEGPLSRDRMAELALGLKDAIDGEFYVASIDDDKIVFGNRECPFGDAVEQAPSLCRMTSSVFGGIASRNSGRDVAVHLEERIAVGDPECRVTVWFDPPPAEVEVFVHRYTNQN